ncbi:MAG: hypothetical protein LBD67_08850 [Candidatus Accumulibacter sp.]|jgi:uncharacterized protein|nr:hypothetical protein [Accumulibacter sp.]
MRQALLIVFVIIVLMLLRKGRGRARRTKEDRDSPAGHLPERMVECAFCGVNSPVSENVRKLGRYYCCEQHRDADA